VKNIVNCNIEPDGDKKVPRLAKHLNIIFIEFPRIIRTIIINTRRTAQVPIGGLNCGWRGKSFPLINKIFGQAKAINQKMRQANY
jgi:hypothetical protein